MISPLIASVLLPLTAWVTASNSTPLKRADRLYYQERTVQTSDGDSASVRLIFFHTRDVRLKVIDYGDSSGPKYSSLGEAFAANDCVAGVNGGFFHPDMRPSGLMIEEGKRVNQFENAKLLSGVLYADGDGIHIVRKGEFRDHPDIRALLQTGPFLVDRGARVSGLSTSNARRRTFIATDYRGNWVLGVTSSVTLSELGEILASPEVITEWPINRALNLDGGSSCGLWFDRPGTPLDVQVRPWKRVRNLVGISLREDG